MAQYDRLIEQSKLSPTPFAVTQLCDALARVVAERDAVIKAWQYMAERDEQGIYCDDAGQWWATDTAATHGPYSSGVDAIVTNSHGDPLPDDM
jgi:hypothetical protein